MVEIEFRAEQNPRDFWDTAKKLKILTDRIAEQLRLKEQDRDRSRIQESI